MVILDYDFLLILYGCLKESSGNVQIYVDKRSGLTIGAILRVEETGLFIVN